ncbi:hypothetical protein H4F17_17320 [Vibrio cholerae]
MRYSLRPNAILCLGTIALFGCSDSDSIPSSDQAVSGKLIDGYISGAKMFMDLNFNSEHDEDEPYVITNSDGSFLFPKSVIDSQPCWKHVPIVAFVPVGAVDSDNPNNTIADAYTMTFPPLSFKGSLSEVYVTPLTTTIWNGVNDRIQLDGLVSNCTEMLNNENTFNELKQLVIKEEVKAAKDYSETNLNLYSDYIATGNKALHAKAKSTVIKLKEAYKHEMMLRDSTPEAVYIRVSYFKDEGDTIRYQSIVTKDGYITKYEHVNENDLSMVISLETHEIMKYIYNNDKSIKLESSVTIDDRTTDTATYSCIYDETYKQLGDGITYGIENQAKKEGVADMEECKTITLATNPSRQVLGARTRINSLLMDKTRLKYPVGQFHQDYEQYFDLGNNPDNISHTVLNSLSFIKIDFESNESYGSPGWARARYDYTQPTNYLVKDVHENGDFYARVIEYFDGQIETICGNSLESLNTNPPSDCY